MVVACQQFPHAVDRGPGGVLFDVVPGADPARIGADNEQRINERSRSLVQCAMDLREEGFCRVSDVGEDSGFEALSR